MTIQTTHVVELPGVQITIFCQDTEEDAVNPNLFDEDFSPAVYALHLLLPEVAASASNQKSSSPRILGHLFSQPASVV
jgi:hypothetical protein